MFILHELIIVLAYNAISNTYNVCTSVSLIVDEASTPLTPVSGICNFSFVDCNVHVPVL